MTKRLVGEDETYKYIIKKLNVRFLRRIGYDCNDVEFVNVELIPLESDQKFMDICMIVDGKYKLNLELQSTAVYEPKMLDMYKYRIYSQSEEFTPFKTIVVATYPQNHGITELEIDGDIHYHPSFFFINSLKIEEILKTIRDKINNNMALTDDEAIDLLLVVDSNHNYDIKELLEITTELLVNAIIPDREFHLDLMDCQKKILKRFLKQKDRWEIEKMINFKAEDFGLKPNVTGFEEEINLAYLDGQREGFDEGKQAGYDEGKQAGYDDGKQAGFDDGKQAGYDDGKSDAKLEIARKMIKSGLDDNVIVNMTELKLNELQKLKEEINKI